MTARVKRRRIVHTAIFGLYLLLMLAWVSKGPRVWVDESWEAIPGYQLVTTGRLNNPIVTGIQGRERHNLGPSMTFNLFMAASFKLLGVGVFQGRLVSLLAIFLAVVLTYALALRFFGPTVAILSALLAMIANLTFVAAATIRPEALVAASTILALYLFILGDDHGQSRYHAAAGLVAGVALHIHPNSFLGLVALVSVFLYRQGFGCLRRRHFWIFAGGVFLGFLPYAIYVFVQDYHNHFHDFLAQIGGRAKPLARGSFLITTLTAELGRYRQFVYFPKRALIAGLDLIALFYGLLARDRNQRMLSIFVLIHLILFPLLIVNRTARYFTVLVPFLSILFVRMLADWIPPGFPGQLSRHRFSTRQRWLATSAFLLFLAYAGNQLAGDFWLVRKNRHQDYRGFIARVRDHLPAGSRVWGSITFWLGLHDHPYRSQYTYGKDIDSFKPEYVIVNDADTWGRRSPTTGKIGTGELMAGTRRILDDLVAQRGHFIAEIDDPFYGDVKIYRITWNDATTGPGPKDRG